MDQNILTFTDISYINLNYNNINTLLDLNYKNIFNIKSAFIKSELCRFIKLDFSRSIVIKNIKLLSNTLQEIKYKLYYNIPYTSIYKPYTTTYEYSANIDDLSPVSNVVAELEVNSHIPNTLQYEPLKTDKYFIIDDINETNIKWSYSNETSNIRYSFSIPNGEYSISEINNELLKLKFDTRGPINIFKNNHPIEINGTIPNFKLNLINNSSNDIIIYPDSNLFVFFEINQTVHLSSNSSYTITFKYEPNKNLPLVLSYNNFSLYSNYNAMKSMYNFADVRPITDELNTPITYINDNISADLAFDNELINFHNKSKLVEINIGTETAGLRLLIDDVSSNNIINENSNISYINTYDSSLSFIDVSGVILTKNLNSQYIYSDNITVSNPIYIQNIISNTLKCDNLLSNSIDISYGNINIKNKIFNIKKNNYKYLKFDISYNIYRKTTFNQLTFYNINNENPLFRVWKYNNYAYDLLSNYDISFSGTIDSSYIIFEFKKNVESGLSFHYKKNDLNKIFKINSTNNSIYYKSYDNLFITNDVIIKATIPDGSYNLAEINKMLAQKFLSERVDEEIKINSNGFLQAEAPGYGNVLNLNTDISYSIIPNNASSVYTKTTNILSFFIDNSFNACLKDYNYYSRFTQDDTKLMLFIKNINDISYSIYYNLNDPSYNNSFFNYFFNEDISYIIPNNIDTYSKFFNYSSFLNYTTKIRIIPDPSFIDTTNPINLIFKEAEISQGTSFDSSKKISLFNPTTNDPTIGAINSTDLFYSSNMINPYWEAEFNLPIDTSFITVRLHERNDSTQNGTWNLSCIIYDNNNPYYDVSSSFQFTFIGDIQDNSINIIQRIDNNIIDLSWNINSKSDATDASFIRGKFIDISNNVNAMTNYWGVNSNNDTSGNTFAALLTLKQEFNEVPFINLYYKNHLSTDISLDDWTPISYNKRYKNGFFLYENFVDNTNDINYFNYYNDNIYYNIPFNNNIIDISNSNDKLLYDKYNLIINTYDSSLVNLHKNTIYSDKNVLTKDLSTNAIHYNTLNAMSYEYTVNQLNITNTASHNKITALTYDLSNNISLESFHENTRLANFTSINPIYSGQRMNIGNEISGNDLGWKITMLDSKNKDNAGDAAIIFRSYDNNKTWFDMSCDIVLSNKNFTSTSDDRLKYNEVDISNAIETIKKIKPKSYIKTRNIYSSNHVFDSSNIVPGTIPETGYIAQEILNIPELTHLVSKQYKYSLNYNGIQPYLCKAIQELNNQITIIEKKIEELETQS